MTTTPSSPLLEKLDPAAEATMRALIGGAMRTQAVYVAAKLGIADQLSLGPRSAEELAQRTGAHAGTLKRLLRFLVFNGVFTEQDDGRFALNRPAESLQSGHPRSLRPSAIRSGEGMWELSARLLSAVQTGRTPYEELHGTPYFERMSERGKDNEFAARMSSSTASLGEEIATLPAVQGARTVVDVGGGHGALLVPLLRAHPHVRGVLFDRPATVEGARPFLERSGVATRCELVTGDFFESVPAGGDVYLLSWILHDWDDERAIRIARACREAAAEGATLVVVEILLPVRAEPSAGPALGVIADPYTSDLQMMLLTGGRERTAREYHELLSLAGWEVREVSTPLSSRGATVIQAYVAAQGGRGAISSR
jgi:hypothetical protein